jgi:RimJ/RimL family protein N-acetyltransferase
MSTVTIGVFRPSLQEAVVRHILAIENEEFAFGLSIDDQPDLKDVATTYQLAGGQFWVAQSDAEVVATLGLFALGHGDADLRKMFVRHSHRGGRPSLAQRMLDVAMEWAVNAGIGRVFLETSLRFQAAIRLYERNGFVQIQRNELPSSFPVIRVAERFYVRHVHGQGGV